MKEFCCECQNFKTIEIREEKESTFMNGKEYQYIAKYAYCKNCGSEVYLQKLKNQNLKAFRSAYNEKIKI